MTEQPLISVTEFTKFFNDKKAQLMASLQGEQSKKVGQYYVKGFFQSLLDKIHLLNPDFDPNRNASMLVLDPL